MSFKEIVKNWWKWLKYSPNDPRFNAGGVIKIAVIGGGTGLSNLLRGLKKYSNHISAIVTVADSGGSTGELRSDFDMVAPGDIRKCIGALAYNEKLFSDLLEYRFSDDKKGLGGHTLGNIWITALTDHYKSFEKAIEVTSEVFQTAGKVLPATLDNIDIKIEYKDGSTLQGEKYLDEVVKPISKISLSKKNVHAYKEAVDEIEKADMIIIGPGSLYGSILPNLLVPGIKNAILANEKAIKVYVANCSTERTQTPNYTVDDHIAAFRTHAGKIVFNYCMVNSRVLKRSEDTLKLGEINNITTNKDFINNVHIIKEDVVDCQKPLYHDSGKLAKALIDLYNIVKRS